MSKRTRIHPVQFYLNDDEQYILEEKYRLSRMKSKSAFLRKMILYGFVYEVDYSHIRKMNTLLGNISSNLNQITHRINSTNTVYPKDLDDIKELMEKTKAIQALNSVVYRSLKEANTDFNDYLDSLIGSALYDVKHEK